MEGDISNKKGAAAWSELKSCFWLCSQCNLCVRYPKVLPCLHTLCQVCLENYLQQQNAVSGGRFKCPVCKILVVLPQKGVMAFATNSYIEQLQQSHGCAVDKFGERTLELCTCYLCTSYRSSRKAVEEKELEREKTLASEKADLEKQVDAAFDFQLQPCSFHSSENLLYFCVDCQQTGCRLCVELRHRDHRFEPIVLAVENAKSLLKTTREVLEVRQCSNAMFLSKLKSYSDDLAKHKDKALKDVDDCISEMHSILNRVKKRLTGDVDRAYSTENGSCSALIEELELSQQQLVGVSGFLAAHEGHDPAEIIQQRFLITDRINQLYAAEQKANFPLSISFNSAIHGFGKDDSWRLRAETALKNAVGSIVSSRVLASEFIPAQEAMRGEINKGVLLATYSLVVPSSSDHEKINLAEKTRRLTISNRQMVTVNAAEVALSRHLLPSVTVDSNGYLIALDRSTNTVARFFGGCELVKRTFQFPADRSRPLRICNIGVSGGFAYVDAVSPSPNSLCFSLRFVPPAGDRYDLILPLDRALFGAFDIGLLDKIPAICSDQNANIYALDIDGDGCANVVIYSMSFGSVRRVSLEISKPAEVAGSSIREHHSVTSSATSGRRDVSFADEPPEPTKNVVNADLISYIACCPHCTGTREVVPSTAASSTCPGILAVVDTQRNIVRLFDVHGALVCELVVPSPLEAIAHPRGVAFDYQGNLILCDQGNNRLLLFDHSGRRLRGILAAGAPALEELRQPVDVAAVPGKFQCYVVEETTQVVKMFDYTNLVAPLAQKKLK